MPLLWATSNPDAVIRHVAETLRRPFNCGADALRAVCTGPVAAPSLPATRVRAQAPAPAAAGLTTLVQPPVRAPQPAAGAAGAATAANAPALNGAAFGVGWCAVYHLYMPVVACQLLMYIFNIYAGRVATYLVLLSPQKTELLMVRNGATTVATSAIGISGRTSF